jgi:hemoglobin
MRAPLFAHMADYHPQHVAILDVVGLPDDAEFRSAFVGYIEFGSRCAMANSQPDAEATHRTTIKKWDWGEALPGGD